MSDVGEVAKAVQKLSEFGSKALGSADKLGMFLGQILKEPVVEAVGIFTDRIKFARWKRIVEMQIEVNALLESRKIGETRGVPPKLAIPLLQEASLEDDSDLQALWNRLLVNAMDPAFCGDLRAGFIDMIRGLSGRDVRILDFIYKVLKADNKLRPIEGVLGFAFDKEAVTRSLLISEADYQVSIFNLMRIQCVAPALIKSTGISFGGEPTTIYKGTDSVTITPLGVEFVQACME